MSFTRPPSDGRCRGLFLFITQKHCDSLLLNIIISHLLWYNKYTKRVFVLVLYDHSQSELHVGRVLFYIWKEEAEFRQKFINTNISRVLY